MTDNVMSTICFSFSHDSIHISIFFTPPARDDDDDDDTERTLGVFSLCFNPTDSHRRVDADDEKIEKGRPEKNRSSSHLRYIGVVGFMIRLDWSARRPPARDQIEVRARCTPAYNEVFKHYEVKKWKRRDCR